MGWLIKVGWVRVAFFVGLGSKQPRNREWRSGRNIEVPKVSLSIINETINHADNIIATLLIGDIYNAET